MLVQQCVDRAKIDFGELIHEQYLMHSDVE